MGGGRGEGARAAPRGPGRGGAGKGRGAAGRGGGGAGRAYSGSACRLAHIAWKAGRAWQALSQASSAG